MPSSKDGEIEYNPYHLFQSDTEIYNTLLDAKKAGHKLLKFFKILYPDKIPQEPITAIYIGRLDTLFKPRESSFDHNSYTVQTEIYITSKSYERLERRRLLKSATYAVIEVLEHSVIGDALRIVNQSFVYDTNNILQYSRILVETREVKHLVNCAEEELSKVCSIMSCMSIDGEKCSHNVIKLDNEEEL